MNTIEPGASARRTRTITRRDIELFTEISGDRNPIHYDDELAAASRFGGIVVQGGVTSGLLNALVAEQLPGPGSVFLEVSWKFLRPGPARRRDHRRGDRHRRPRGQADHHAAPPPSPTRTASSCSTAPPSSGVTRPSRSRGTVRGKAAGRSVPSVLDTSTGADSPKTAGPITGGNHERHHREPAASTAWTSRPCSPPSTPSRGRTRSPSSSSAPPTPGSAAPTAGRSSPASTARCRRWSTTTRPRSSPTTRPCSSARTTARRRSSTCSTASPPASPRASPTSPPPAACELTRVSSTVEGDINLLGILGLVGRLGPQRLRADQGHLPHRGRRRRRDPARPGRAVPPPLGRVRRADQPHARRDRRRHG